MLAGRRLSSLYAGMTIERERVKAIIIAYFPKENRLSLEDELLRQRWARIREIESMGYRAYGKRYDFSHAIPQILAEYSSKTAEELSPELKVRIAGRVKTIRSKGKAGFAHLAQNGEQLQIYVRSDAVSANDFRLFQILDIGDVIGAEGYLFRTRTGELSVHVERLEFLSKTLFSMPEKWHGLEDVEMRYRQRYLDLIANPESRKVFITRSKIIASLRRQLEGQGFIEVETPMMQPLYGGATARPFITHHNTLDIDLYLRIAPELYLKRLVVGGYERVYEIGRDFRNEGIDRSHNPEFTMMECYQAFADYEDIMRLVEEMIYAIALEVKGSPRVTYQGTEIDLTPPWQRYRLLDAIEEFTGIDVNRFADKESLAAEMRANGYEADPKLGRGRLIDDLKGAMFRKGIPVLRQAMFLTDYPRDVSPLAKDHLTLP